MSRVLVVDDEVSVVEALSTTIPWDELGVSAVFTATSGEDALNLLDRYPIDVVLSDIRMPEISGIELIKRMEQQRKQTKIIFLSGYSEFEYAQQALHYNVFRYLLKPVSDEDLITAIKEALSCKHQEMEQTASYNRAVGLFKENIVILRQNALHSLIQDKMNNKDLQEAIERYDLPFAVGDRVTVLLIRIEEASKWTNTALLEFAIGNIAKEVLAYSFELSYCTDRHGYIVLLLKSMPEEILISDERTNANSRFLEGLSIKLQSFMKNYLMIQNSILIGGWGDFPEDVPRLYQNCLLSLQLTVMNEKEFVMDVSDHEKTKNIAVLSELYKPPHLIQLLQAGRWDDAEKKIETAFHELEKAPSILPEHVMEAFFFIFNSLISISHQSGLSFFKLINSNPNNMIMADGAQDLNKTRDLTYQIFFKIKEELDNKDKGERSFVVNQIQKYIENNLNNDVSLQAISDQIFMHPVYLSQLYKSETNEGISDYIMRCRMERAAYLLQNTNQRIQDISKEIGYQNTSYFIRVFKQYYERTPQEYRDRMN